MKYDRNIWRGNWLSCINELTSLNLQKQCWLDKTNTNPHWSFVEFMCCYFDDLAIEDNYKYPLENGWLAKQEFEIIKDWHESLGKYESPNNNDYDHQAILSDSRWLDILQMGLAMKSKLEAILDENERRILTENIYYTRFAQQ
ncbi:hypothetical protein SDC9_55249 [bioreactor metagenome]|uniref:Uncharacterized protein n=1 Tax=bioreactor metagenome TaxID=1076179 RepID=A0A644X3Q3_9ZZZZ